MCTSVLVWVPRRRRKGIFDDEQGVTLGMPEEGEKWKRGSVCDGKIEHRRRNVAIAKSSKVMGSVTARKLGAG